MPTGEFIFYLLIKFKIIEDPEHTMIFFPSRSQMVNFKV